MYVSEMQATSSVMAEVLGSIGPTNISYEGVKIRNTITTISVT